MHELKKAFIERKRLRRIQTTLFTSTLENFLFNVLLLCEEQDKSVIFHLQILNINF